MKNESSIKSATKTAIYELDEDGIVAFIGLTQGDIANLDATKENYWETKSNLQQNIIWAWERFSQLRTAEYLGFGKKDKRETDEGKDFDLVEILKDCPSDTKLYSPLFGEVKLVYVIEEGSDCPIVVRLTSEFAYGSFTRSGRYLHDVPGSECMLFPSKDNRDWSTFKSPNC